MLGGAESRIYQRLSGRLSDSLSFHSLAVYGKIVLRSARNAISVAVSRYFHFSPFIENSLQKRMYILPSVILRAFSNILITLFREFLALVALQNNHKLSFLLRACGKSLQALLYRSAKELFVHFR